MFFARCVGFLLPGFLVFALPLRADDKGMAPLPRAELDSRLDTILYEATVLGVKLYNAGDQAGCFRVYQTSLMAIEPLLDHRPQLRSMIREELKKADAIPSMTDRAFALRKTIDKTREGLKSTTANKSLWDRLGGEPAVRAVVKEFIVVVAPDPKVNFTRNGKYQPKPEDIDRIEQRLVELVSAVSGGPLKYTGKNMKDSHMGMGITDDEFDAAAGHLIAVLKKFKVPQAEIDELVGIIAGTRKDIVEMPRESAKKSLWDRLGGEPAVNAVIDDFVARAAGNPKVNFTRKGTASEWEATPENVARLKKRLVQLVSVVAGGPIKYEGRGMKEAHAGMKITNAEFDALASDLKATLDKFKVPEAEQQELLQIIGGTRKDIVEEK